MDNRDVNRPLGAGLFFYECFRLLVLVFFLMVTSAASPMETPAGLVNSGIYSVYMSSNALFPLMALFIWLKPGEYRNFTTLYMAGKVIAVITFYVWEIFSMRRGIASDLLLGPGAGDTIGVENVTKSLILFGGSALLSLTDILSVWGAWVFNKKYRRALAPESGGL